MGKQKITIRRYSELICISSFHERFKYLKLDGVVGADTFGFDRYLNQRFYKSREWRNVRDQIIFRDNGCDLGVEGHDIHGRIIIHHMNPITIDDIDSSVILDPEFLICVTHDTHNAIHYGDENLLVKDLVVRKPGDTCPWR